MTSSNDVAKHNATAESSSVLAESVDSTSTVIGRLAREQDGLATLFESGAISQLLRIVVQHMGGSAVVIGADLKVCAYSGELFSSEQESAHAESLARQLGDDSLAADLSAVSNRNIPLDNDFVSHCGQWLRRSISVLGGSDQLVLISYRDISKEYLQNFISECHDSVMKALVRHESPKAIFTALALRIESCFAPGTHASVLWLSPDGQHLRHIAGPTLPEAYTSAIDGVAIGPNVGSCGTAAYKAQRVVVEDIQTDPLWANYRDVALSAGLRACWSQPIMSPTGTVLGTLALYRETAAVPSTAELELLDAMVQLSSIAIRDLRSEGEINFQAALLDSVRDAVIAIDQHGRIRYWGSGATELFGYRPKLSQRPSLESIVDISEGLGLAHEQGFWTGQASVENKQGSQLTLEVSVSAIVHLHDEERGFVAILRDVSDRRAAEQKVADQNRQNRAIAYLGRLALGNIDQQTLLDFAMESLANVLDIPLCMFFELQPSMNSLALRAGSGLEDGLVGEVHLASDYVSQIGYTLLSSTPVISEDIRSETRFNCPDLLHEHKVVSALSIIVHGLDNKPYGVLGVYSKESRKFSESEINFLQSVANVLAESLHREHTNKSLRNSEQKFRDLADSMPQIVWSADAEGKIDYFNERWNSIVGFSSLECDTDAWLSALHPHDRERWVAGWHVCIRDRTPFEIEIRILVNQHSGYKWYLARALPIVTSEDESCRWYGSCTDINEQKIIEHRLREQAHELEMVNWINATLAAELDLEKLVQVVIDVGTQLSGAGFGAYFHRIDDIDEQSYSLYALSGLPRDAFDELVMPRASALFKPTFDGEGVIRSDDILADSRYGKSPAHLGLPEDHPAVRSYLAVPVVSRTGKIIGGMFFGHPDVGRFDSNDERLMTGLAIQAAIAVDNVKVYHDLIDSKNEVRGQYEQLNAIYATAPIGLCYVDSRLRLVSINNHLRGLVGYTGDNVQERQIRDVLGGAAITIEPLCNEVLINRKPILNREINWSRHEDGKDYYWLCSCYPIVTSDGSLLGINSVIQDITDRKRGELDLARLASIISNSYDAIIGKTLDGKITSWNQGAERIFGYKTQEVIGQSISLIIPDQLLQQEHEILEALRNGQHVTIDETNRVRKDGVPIQVALTLSPIRNAEGEIIGVSTIIRDLTASKIAEQLARENEDRMRLILQATHIGTWDWQIGTGKVRWSDNMEALHGRPSGSFDGTLNCVLSEVYSEDKGVVKTAITQALDSNGEYQIEYRIVTQAGEIRWLEGKGQVLYDLDGKPERLAGVCMDITERKTAEQALRVNETMLRTQTEELAREHRQKDEFLAMLAHELRNPLAPISNMVQLIKIQDSEQREKTLPQAIDVIGRQVSQMARLVDDLLDVARITRGLIELKSEQQDLRSILKQAVETARAWFDAKHQVFELVIPDTPICTFADTTRMIQVVSNLLNNASKYTGDSGRISLTLSSVGREAVISVSDNGIGISADLLPHVFDLFTQADRSLDRRQGGLGLGLPLVRKLVDMHQGTVVASSPGMGRGSEFIIRLPLVDTAEVSTSAAGSVTTQLTPNKSASRVLVVDDNVQAADAMAMLLETLGHVVKVAYSGPDALCAADQFGPDLVFLDIGLPLMDGYEVAAKLRARFGGQITLIALTGYSQQSTKLGSAKLDFDEYILKPLSLDNLVTLLAKRVPEMRSQREQ